MTRLRLKAEAHVWMEAPSIDTLIPLQQDRWKRELLKKAANSDIALWLEHNRATRQIVQQGGVSNILAVHGVIRGIKTSKYQLPRNDITSQTHDDLGWTYG